MCYTSFHKNPDKYGYSEIKSLEKLGAKIIVFAKGHPHLDKTVNEDDIKTQTAEAFDTLYKLLQEHSFDVLIMDEILISVRDKYIEEEKLLDFIEAKPATLELVLTGRSATDKVMELADYVSFVKKIKHPYDKKITSRKGIEY